MQNSTLPIQVSGASAPNAPQRPSNNGDTGEFSAALAREIEQRKESQPAAPAPQPSRAQAAKQPQAQDKPANTAKPAAKEPDTPASQAADKPADDPQPEEAKDAEAAGQPDKVADILALMANSNQPLQKAGGAAPAGDGEVDMLAHPAGHAQPDALQFAALQAATRRLGQDSGAGAQVGAAAGQERASLTDALAGAQAKGAAQAADLHAAATAPGQPKPQVEFSAQLAREAAAQAEAFKTAATPAPLSLAQVQQAMANPALVAAAGDHLPARVGTQAWDSQVGQKVVWMVAGGDQTAELTLNPPDLGPMQVVLSVNGDQASVQFSANQQEVRQALENALPRLREMMSESGIALGSATVSTGTPDQRQAQGEQAGNGRGGDGATGNGTASAETAPRTARTTVLGEHGMVDTFA